MLNQIQFFQHQLCLFSPGDGQLQKMASCNFYLTHGGIKNFSEIAMIKKPNYLTFDRAMSGFKRK